MKEFTRVLIKRVRFPLALPLQLPWIPRPLNKADNGGGGRGGVGGGGWGVCEKKTDGDNTDQQ
jgi:hypothetical protein